MAQDLKGLAYVSPFHESLAAVKKGEMWAFIDMDGTVVINFRNDLVAANANEIDNSSTDESPDYPFFKNDRTLIKETRDGITYYGYINSKGKMVIKPSFINATQFYNNRAIVLKVYKETVGRNEILGKNVISYSYNEEVIDSDGETVGYLRGPFNLIYDKKKLKTPPKIQSRFLGPNLFSTKAEDNTWKIQTINRK